MADATPTLYDGYGRAIRRSDLRSKRTATPTTTGVRPIARRAITDGLTPERLARIMREIDDGEYRAYLQLAEEMEEREPHYSSVLYTRKLAVSSLELGCKPVSDDDDDEELAAEVLRAFQNAGGADLVDSILDAIGKGFSVHELTWDTSRTPWRPKIEYVDPGWFVFKGQGRREDIRLRDEADPQNGIELAPARWLVHFSGRKSGHPIRSGTARLVCTSYMCKAFDLKDWMAFAEVYGMPLRVGKYRRGLDTNVPEDLADLQALIDAVANLGTDAAAVIPEDMSIEFETAQRGDGAGVFERIAVYIDKQVSKAVLGQTMTTDEGASLSQSQTHGDVKEEYRNADVRRLMTTIARDFTKPYVDINYGVPEDEVYPVIFLDTAEPEDLVAFSKGIAPLIDRGLRVPEAFVRAKFGIPDLDGEGDELALQPMSKAGGAKPPGDDEEGDEEEPDDQDDPPEEDDEEEEAAAEARASFLALAKRAKRKRKQQSREDILDELVNAALAEVDTNPMLAPVLELAAEADGFEDFRERLPTVIAAMDSSELGDSLAVAMFKARGLGDASDSTVA